MKNEDELLHRVGALAAPTLQPDVAARIHARARAAFERAERPPGRFSVAATTVAVVTAVAVYLTWAVEFLGMLAS